MRLIHKLKRFIKDAKIRVFLTNRARDRSGNNAAYILTKPPIPANDFSTRFNKDIYIYWNAGFDEAPAICRLCVQSWIEKNPDWNIHLLDDKKIADMGLLTDLNLPNNTKFANWLRLELVHNYGGLWVDATLYCQVPLDYWLPELMSKSDTFLFNKIDDRLVDVWFIAAHKGSELIRRYKEEYARLWRSQKSVSYPYFAVQYLFEFLVTYDKEFYAEWIKMVRSFVYKNLPEKYAQFTDEPVKKLTWKRYEESVAMLSEDQRGELKLIEADMAEN